MEIVSVNNLLKWAPQIAGDIKPIDSHGLGRFFAYSEIHLLWVIRFSSSGVLVQLKTWTDFTSLSSNDCCGWICRALDQQLRDAFCIYLEDRGVSKRLFSFLQSWLYLKDHHNIMNWFRKVSDFINDIKPTWTLFSMNFGEWPVSKPHLQVDFVEQDMMFEF